MIVNIGVKKCYLIDIPKTRSQEESLNSLITVLEDCKNGHIVSSMYGTGFTLLMDPPNIIIFSNQSCPVKLMSEDRWKCYEIDRETFDLKDVKPNYSYNKYRAVPPSKPLEKEIFSEYKDIRSDLIKDTTSKNALEKAKNIAKFAGDLVKTKAGPITLYLISNGISSAINNAKSIVPGYSENRTLTDKIGEDETKVYILRFHVGMNSTRSVKEKQNGYYNLQLGNSLSDALDTNSRNYLRCQFGFNAKSFDFLNEKFYVTLKDYENIYKISKWNIAEHSLQVPYGLVKSEFSNLKIRNLNSYHKIKIHIVKILDNDRTMKTL